MAARRPALVWGGAAVAAAAGYYLYRAGGDPKLAEKKAEHDVSRMTSSIRSTTDTDAKTRGKEWGKEAGAKIDETIAQAKARTAEMDRKVDGYRKEAEVRIDELKNTAAKDLNQAVDKFDKTVVEKTAEAKKGISSWFGSK